MSDFTAITKQPAHFDTGLPGVSMVCGSLGSVLITGLKGGRGYRLSIEAGLGDFNLERLFFDLQPGDNRDKAFRMGPINTTFGPGTLGEYLPPRMDCFINDEFYYSIWFDCPTLAELLNCPEILEKYPFLNEYNVNSDDGFGPREFVFTSEGAVEIPEGCNSLRLRFPKDFGMPELRSVKIEMEKRLQRAAEYDLSPVEVPHPRLFACGDPDGFRGKLMVRSPEMLNGFMKLLDEKLADPPDEVPLQNPDGREYWDIFDRIACYSFGFMVFGKEDYFKVAEKHAQWLFSRPHWGKHMELDECGNPWTHYWCDVDMCQGITPFLAGIFFYDWCRNRIDTPLLEKIEKKLLHHAKIMYRHYLAELAEWACQFNTDHFTGNVYPLQLCGFLFADKYPEAKRYLDIGRICFEDSAARCFDAHRRPETYHTQLPLLGYAYLYKDFYGENLMRGIDVSTQVHTRLISSLGGGLNNTFSGFSECEACLYFGIANLTGSEHAQWIAGELAGQSPKGGVKVNGFRKVMELIFHDPEIGRISPADLPRILFDSQKAAFFYREKWDDLISKNADGVCGINLLFQKTLLDRDLNAPDIRKRSYWGSPYAGNFSLFCGRKFLISPVVPTCEFSTAKANCMTVDGKGQVGEGPSFIFPAVSPGKMPKAWEEETEYLEEANQRVRKFRITADLGGIYDRSLVDEYLRSYVIEEILLDDNSGILTKFTVVDEIKSSGPHRFAFSFISGMDMQAQHGKAGKYLISGTESGNGLSLAINSPCKLKYHTEELKLINSYMPSHDRKPYKLRVSCAKPECNLKISWEMSLCR